LLRRFPELGKVNLELLDEGLGLSPDTHNEIDAAINRWVAAEIDCNGIQADYGIEPLDKPEPERNPLTELGEMVGPDKVIGVIA
jgi:hypothetical protein